MILQAKYVKIFHLDIDGTSVKVVLDCISSQTVVSFSDGFTATYNTSSIPAHTVSYDSSGSVTVTVTTENGTYDAVCHYTVSDGGGNGSGKDKETVNIDLTYFVLGLAIVGMIVFAYRRGYL